jgi:hypothetical protein
MTLGCHFMLVYTDLGELALIALGPVGMLAPPIPPAMLEEPGGYILLEDGSFLLLE